MSNEVDNYKIYVDQLRDGKIESVGCFFPPEMMDVQDDALAFDARIHVKGEAYVSDHALILHLDLHASAVIPCSICNASVDTPVVVKGIYHLVPLDEIKGHIFDIREVVRENILLNTPLFSECNEGNCSERQFLKKYLKSDEDLQQKPFEGQQPFKDLPFM
ncbi:putative uncharacterized protein [Waddlia chondrophila 2032/99]|nr:hypothetical protein [Waddlia chondrophila]CCB91828.1 putative uncharacterized protein [Waddlia chondrophila 2032/99]